MPSFFCGRAITGDSIGKRRVQERASDRCSVSYSAVGGHASGAFLQGYLRVRFSLRVTPPHTEQRAILPPLAEPIGSYLPRHRSAFA